MTKMQKAAKKVWVTIRKNKQVRHDAAKKAWVTRRQKEVLTKLWVTRRQKEVLIKMAEAGISYPELIANVATNLELNNEKLKVATKNIEINKKQLLKLQNLRRQTLSLSRDSNDS